MSTFDPNITGALIVFALWIAALAVLLWPEPTPRRWQPPDTLDADIRREREALLSAAHRIGADEGVREDLLGELERFAEGLAARVADGRTARAVAITRITRKAQRLAGPDSASAAALEIRRANGIAEGEA